MLAMTCRFGPEIPAYHANEQNQLDVECLLNIFEVFRKFSGILDTEMRKGFLQWAPYWSTYCAHHKYRTA
jgi:hypothetical protein